MSEKLSYTAPEMEIFGAPDSRGDLIFREAAKAVLENRYRIRTHLHDLAAAQQLKIAEWEIADLPAADARPVVRGRWEWTVDDDDRLGEYWKCNLCGERSYIGKHRLCAPTARKTPRRCPN